MRLTANVFNAPLAATTASCAANWANLFSALTKLSPVMLDISSATSWENSGCVFRPVPTAVPPKASSNKSSSAKSNRRKSASNCETQPDTSCPRVRGTASMRCVRPILTISDHFSALSFSAFLNALTLGNNSWTKASAAAMCIAVGKVSLDDWARLTWSFGCTGVLEPMMPPAISIPRFAITSFVFIFD